MGGKYEIHTTRAVEKDLDKLPKEHFEIVKDEILGLENDPFKGETLKGKLKDCRSIKFTLPGKGDYRVVYLLKKPLETCLVFFMGSREDVYEEAARKVEALKKQGLI